MGHLVNPITSRLSINSFWNSNWVLLNNFNYINLFKKDYLLFQFLNWFIKKSKLAKYNIIISHYKIYRLQDKVFINFYYYNAGLEEKTYHFQVLFFKNILLKRNNLNKKIDIMSSIKIKGLYKYIIKILISNLYWYLLNKSLSFYLKKLNITNHFYYFNIYSLNFLNITTEIISSYIALKLQSRNSLDWILQPILKDLSKKIKQGVFLGYKIVCSGRFTRKQIATYIWMKKGAVPLNSLSNIIKYSESKVRLKYGLCGIKVWLNYGYNDSVLFTREMSLIYPLYTPFKYTINLKTNLLVFYLNYWSFLYLKIISFKLRSYQFYEFFLKLKINIFLKHLFLKLSKKYLLKKFMLSYTIDNKFIIKMINVRINYLEINRKIYE